MKGGFTPKWKTQHLSYTSRTFCLDNFFSKFAPIWLPEAKTSQVGGDTKTKCPLNLVFLSPNLVKLSPNLNCCLSNLAPSLYNLAPGVPPNLRRFCFQQPYRCKFWEKNYRGKMSSMHMTNAEFFILEWTLPLKQNIYVKLF